MKFILDIADKNILVLGGHNASDTVRQCLQENSQITLISPKDQLDTNLLKLAHDGQIGWFNREFRAQDLDGKSIVLNFSGNSSVYSQCKLMGVVYYDLGKSGLQIDSSYNQPNMERTITKHQIENWNDFLKDKTTNEILEWAQEEFKDQLFQTTSFGLTGLVTIDLLKAKVPLIFIDTLHNFSETYKLVNDIQTKYHVKIHKFYPKHEQEIKTKTMFVEVFGDELWKTDSVKYDYVVKAEPGFRANKELNAKAVLTGRRRSQGADRKSLDIVELDSSGIVKINALYSWSFDQCWDYIKANNVPYNALTDQGYKSIGDYHSTAKTLEGEGERDGRWKGQEKTECGLHKDYFKMKREQKMK